MPFLAENRKIFEMYTAKRGFEVDGYQYTPEMMREDQFVSKIWHDVVTPQGEKISVDWTPYEFMTPADFKLWLELGKPERITSAPLNSEDLQKLAKAQL